MTVKKRKAEPQDENLREGDELLDQLLSQKQTQKKEDAGCASGGCSSGGCGPKLTQEDKERLAKARQLYHEEKARQAAEAPPPTPVKDFFMSLLKVMTMCGIIIGFLYLKSGAEQYASDRSLGDHLETNPYQTLGIKPNAPIKEIRKAYRNLTLQWHPDRNPGCTDACVDKMELINTAYNVLSDPEKKRAYDKGKVIVGDKIESVFSLDLTEETYNIAMASLTDSTLPITPIVVQVYHPSDDVSQSFARIWETTAESLSHMNIPFVRINALTQSSLVKKLPINIKIHPTVLMLERNKQPLILPLSLAREPKSFRGWIEDNIGPHKMVAVARNANQLKEWARSTCEPRFQQNLPIPDDLARIVVITQSGRPTPSAVVNRVALHFNNVAQFLYASPRAIPDEWKKDVDAFRNNLILMPKCDQNDEQLSRPSRVLGFGKSSYTDFFTNVSYLLSHRSLPLTRKTADALCTSTVMGTPKRLCHVRIVSNDTTEVHDYEVFAKKHALPDKEFNKLKKMAKADVKDDDDTDDEVDDAQFITPLVQYVYVFDHEGGEDCACPKSQMSKLIKSGSSENSMLLDLSSGFIKPCTKEVSISHEYLSDGLISFNENEEKSVCLKSVGSFMNNCLVPGETTQFMQIVQYFKDYNAFDWCILTVGLCVLSFLATALTPAQWCLALFASPMIVQGFMFVSDWLRTSGTADFFDEL